MHPHGSDGLPRESFFVSFIEILLASYNHRQRTFIALIQLSLCCRTIVIPVMIAVTPSVICTDVSGTRSFLLYCNTCTDCRLQILWCSVLGVHTSWLWFPSRLRIQRKKTHGPDIRKRSLLQDDSLEIFCAQASYRVFSSDLKQYIGCLMPILSDINVGLSGLIPNWKLIIAAHNQKK